VSTFNSVFEASCVEYDKRWKKAFTPHNSHFSGNLPEMTSNEPHLDRLYYWSALALVSLERTNFRSFPRQFVISEGPSMCVDGSCDMGGSGQFIWDLSFSSISLSLLEPLGTKNLIRYLIQNSNITAEPMLIPQTWDAYVEGPASIGGYCFDYLATFFLIQQYMVYTNDYEILSLEITNTLEPAITITVAEYLSRLAWSWRSFPSASSSAFLVDYGSDKRSFLEAVSTYTNVIPALQFGNAGMLLAFAEILEHHHHRITLGETEEEQLRHLRGNATGIIKDSISELYNHGKGYWNCSYTDRNTSGEVLAISDFGYLGIALGVMSDSIEELLPQDLRDDSVAFFKSDLQANGWVRALSLHDPVMSNVNSLSPSIEDKLAMRSDWTGWMILVVSPVSLSLLVTLHVSCIFIQEQVRMVVYLV
jgi:hypothetical protein